MDIAELQSRLVIRESPSHRYVPRATAAVLDEAERAMESRLPVSYRQWSAMFGAGELSGHYRIASPMAHASPFELRTFDAQWRGTPEDDLWSGQIESSFLCGMLWFAETVGGESFVWQLKEVTDEVTSEYRVYHIPRHSPPRACANSFGEWLTEVCLTPREHPEWNPEWVFRRFSAE